MSKYPIITISREYGSGGHEIASLLAEKLNLPFYDSEIISRAAKKSGLDTKAFEKAETRATSGFMYSLSLASSTGQNFVPIDDQLFIIQSETLHEIAQEGPAVIVGRCSDFVLKDTADCLNFFIGASMEARTSRIMERLSVDQKTAESKIKKMDKCRATYYNFYTSQKWGARENYSMCIRSDTLGTEGTAEALKRYALAVFGDRLK